MRKKQLTKLLATMELNKLLAEFMGIKVMEGIGYGGNKYYYYNNAEAQDYEGLIDYSSCYNSLMEVLEKIGAMPNFLYPNGIFKFLTHINIEVGTKRVIIKILLKCNRDDNFPDICYYKGTLQENIFNACVDFVKWYNLNKDEKVN